VKDRINKKLGLPPLSEREKKEHRLKLKAGMHEDRNSLNIARLNLRLLSEWWTA